MSFHILNRATICLSVAGLFISGILTLQHFGFLTAPCGIGHGCETVATSPAAVIIGIPVAFAGFLAYMALAVLALGRAVSFRRRQTFCTLGYVLSTVGALVSVCLTSYSFLALKTYCTWCLGSAVVMCATFSCHALLAQAAPAPEVDLRDSAVTLLASVGVVCIATGFLDFGYKIPTYDAVALERATFSDMVPSYSPRYGDPSALTFVVMYGDLTCHTCRRALGELEAVTGPH